MTPRPAQPLSRRPALAGVVALVLVAVLAFPGATSAAKPTLEKIHFHFRDDPTVGDYDDCGEDLPLTVFTTGVNTGYFVVDTHGTSDPSDDTFVSITGTNEGHATFTNTVTGQSVTLEFAHRFRNSERTTVAGHPDQFAVSVTDTGTETLHGPDGTVLWHHAGLTESFVIVIPGEGVVSEEPLIRHGNLADGDFCQVLSTALGL